MRILIVEDDRALNCGLARALDRDEVIQAYSAAEARGCFHPELDLVILDVNLPDGDGMALCREFRNIATTSVIFLTANDLDGDIVAGLESGAEDYITKPFSLEVLRARVNVVRRRREPPLERYREDCYDFDFATKRFYMHDRRVELSRSEEKLLWLLISNRGVTLSRETLIDRIWTDSEEFVDGNALSVAVGRLRRKFPEIPIKTMYGVGYKWTVVK